MFDNFFISGFVEQWKPKTHSFHLPWGEVSIMLQDVAYHLGVVPETFSSTMNTEVVLGVCIPGTHVSLICTAARDNVNKHCGVHAASCVLDLPLAVLEQQSRDRHDGMIQSLRRHIDALTFDEVRDVLFSILFQILVFRT
ncbi:hypothetical protein AHAS_Ahas20G0260700 [Arachis hypogaea]